MSRSTLGQPASRLRKTDLPRFNPCSNTPMKNFTKVLVLAGSLVSATACSSEVTSPARIMSGAASLSTAVASAATTADAGLQSWDTPLTQDLAARADVSPTQGGQLSIPSLGITVRIPAGAVESPTTITMTAMAGGVVALDFQPAGSKFKRPLHVTQDLSFTQYTGAAFDIVYFKNSGDIDQLNKKVKVSEVIPVSVASSMASFDIWHFSGYAVSTGRH